MKKLISLCMLVMLAAPVVYAQDEPVKTEPKLWTAAKAIVDATDPAIEAGWFWNDGNIDSIEAFTGLSGALYNYDQHDLNIASVRLGVALEQNHKLYATAQLNAINAATLYFPDDVKETLSPGFVGSIWEFMGKYGRVGVGPGYDIEAEQFGVVGTVGATVQF